ncbi:hypothetical protein RhiirC2_800542 [Rhizophagus irregularis]|uniref:DNA primase/nucleoside triphosphatase C-terminal domain-containing protein n=1 Tax=Rhizophagus irregularis TaxID=588596 RepID=A0A2N1M3G6_9GLOM|nr:hypothetical protein RhiirC2_800542 [Rhizophagus irregularis]
MRSPPRCGKNILTDFIGERILGRENFLSTTRLEDVMGRFNAASLITEPYICIEEKEIDVKVIDDFAGYMILSNHAMPIRIEMGDERYVALNVSAKYKGNREYFGSLIKVLENQDTASSFISYLLSRDLTSFNPRTIPNTQMKQELIEASIPNLQRFLQYYLEIMWPDNCDTLEIPCTNFYSTYQNWCSEKGENKTLSDNKFSMEIKQFAPKIRVSRSGTRINYYILDKAKIAENISKVIQDVQDVQEAPVEEVELVVEKPAPVEENPAPVIRKTPPPLPPKPDHLKERLQELREEKPSAPEPDNYDILDDLLSDSDSTTANPPDNYDILDDLLSDSDSTTADPVPEKPSAPEPDNYDILDDLLSDSDSTTADPVLEKQPESPAENSAKPESLADSKSSTEPVVEPAFEQLIPEPDTEPEVDRDPELKKGT